MCFKTEYAIVMSNQKQLFFKGATDMLPLSIAVIPWSILAGSMAINAGLSLAKAIAMTAMVFAGAAQLVSLGLFMAGASTFSILVTIFFLTSQHFIYALTLRPNIASQPSYIRLGQGFLLTDEQFALTVSTGQRSMAYLFGAGLCFYLFWVVFGLVGIFFTRLLPSVKDYPLDFSIVAIFIPMILSLIKDKITLIAIISTLIATFVLRFFAVENALILAGLIGMAIAVCCEYLKGDRS